MSTISPLARRPTYVSIHAVDGTDAYIAVYNGGRLAGIGVSPLTAAEAKRALRAADGVRVALTQPAPSVGIALEALPTVEARAAFAPYASRMPPATLSIEDYRRLFALSIRTSAPAR